MAGDTETGNFLRTVNVQRVQTSSYRMSKFWGCTCNVMTVSNNTVLFTWKLEENRSWKGFPGGSGVKNLPANTGDTRDTCSIPGLGRPPGGGNGNPLQYSCLKNPMDRGAWQATVHGVAKSWIWLSDWAHIQIKKVLTRQKKSSYRGDGGVINLIAQYTHTVNHHIGHLKCTQCYKSITSQ